MRGFLALVVPLLCLSVPVRAETIVYETVEEEVVYVEAGGDRFVGVQPAEVPAGIASYGPFRVLDAGSAALVDVTDSRSPAQFAAMLRDYPGIGRLDMIDCPGTDDDRANLRLGDMIRARGIVTHVPSGGSVRSGAVELFLAGVRRDVDDGAEFAVHAWADDLGREPSDYAANGPENRAYLDYYRRMGMAAADAAAFYAMTNSVPNAQAKWLSAAEMRHWLKLEKGDEEPMRRVDLAIALP